MEGNRIQIKQGIFSIQNNLSTYSIKRQIKTSPLINPDSNNVMDGIIADLLGDGHIRFAGKKY